MFTQKHPLITRILHWISAIVILWAVMSGFFLAALDPGSQLRQAISSLNVSVTTLFIPLFLLRVVVAISVPRLPLPSLSRYRKIAARIVHLMLYSSTGLVLASGLMMMNQPVQLFGITAIENPVSNPLWNEFFHELHRYSCIALLVLVIGHIAAVLQHQRAGKNILRRMW